MTMKEAYKKKIEAELELVQANIAKFKAQAKISTADARIKYSKQIGEIEHMVAATKAKLKELGEVGEDTWDQLRDSVENAWGALNVAVRDTAAKFKD